MAYVMRAITARRREVQRRSAHRLLPLVAALSVHCGDTDDAAAVQSPRWVKALATLENADDYAARVACAPGGVYVASPFANEVTLGPTTLQGSYRGVDQAFIAALGASGAPRWTRVLRGDPWVTVRALASDGSGALYATVNATQRFTLEGEPALSPFRGAVALSFTRDGALRWATPLSDSPQGFTSALAVDPTGGLYAGVYVETASTVAGVALPASSSAVVALTAEGAVRWVVPIPGGGAVVGLAFHASRGVVATLGVPRAFQVAGREFAGPLREGDYDAAMLALTSDGTFRWCAELRSDVSEHVGDPAISASGEVVVPITYGESGRAASLALGGATLDVGHLGTAWVTVRDDGSIVGARFALWRWVSGLAYDDDGALWSFGRNHSSSRDPVDGGVPSTAPAVERLRADGVTEGPFVRAGVDWLEGDSIALCPGAVYLAADIQGGRDFEGTRLGLPNIEPSTRRTMLVARIAR